MIFFAIDVHFWLTAASIDTETICRPEKKEQNLMYFSLFILVYIYNKCFNKKKYRLNIHRGW